MIYTTGDWHDLEVDFGENSVSTAQVEVLTPGVSSLESVLLKHGDVYSPEIPYSANDTSTLNNTVSTNLDP